MFDVKQFLEENNIEAITEGKNTSGGWININCPFCRDEGFHGGFCLSTAHYSCWKCGHHWTDETVAALLDIPKHEAKKVMLEYQEIEYCPELPEKKYGTKDKLTFPKGSKDLTNRHRKYLLKREYDPDEIIETWNIKGTDFAGDYKYRIIIPIFVNGKMVSYIGRDITNKSPIRYKACKIEDEVIHHKHIIYGSDYISKRKAIIVEGVTDAWRFGKGAVATFGTGYKKEQLLFISSLIDTAFILYDEEAYAKAKQLYFDLSGIIDHVEIITLQKGIKDPGEMSQEEANSLKKLLLS